MQSRLNKKKIACRIYLAYAWVYFEFNLTVKGIYILFIVKDNFITEIEHFRNEMFMTYFFNNDHYSMLV